MSDSFTNLSDSQKGEVITTTTTTTIITLTITMMMMMMMIVPEMDGREASQGFIGYVFGASRELF